MTDWLRTPSENILFLLQFTPQVMSSASPSPTLPSATDVRLASPSIGPAVCTASLRPPITASPARSISPVRSPRLPYEAPFTVQTSPVHSSIEILPPPPRSSVATTTAPLTCASSFTERALRSQRRDALSALHDVAVPSPSPIHLHESESDFGAQTEYSQMQPFTPRQETPIHNYSNSVPARRATMHVANHPPFTVRVIPPRVFTPLAALRASRSTMSKASSTAPSTKPTSGTAAHISTRTGSPPPPTSGPLLDFSPMGSTDLRASTGSATGRTPGLRPTAPVPRAALTANGGPWHRSRGAESRGAARGRSRAGPKIRGAHGGEVQKRTRCRKRGRPRPGADVGGGPGGRLGRRSGRRCFRHGAAGGITRTVKGGWLATCMVARRAGTELL